MKNIFYIFFLGTMMFIFPARINAQVSVSEDGSPADSSAMLDIKSTTRGFLPPRLNIDQIENIPSPVAGLQVYCTELNLPLFFNGTIWMKMDGNPIYSIGMYYNGGFIFYIFPPGFTVLIGKEFDEITGNWGCYGTYIGGTSVDIGTGDANTTAIITGCPTPGIAAQKCGALEFLGYDDWFLPSREELVQYMNSNVTNTWATGTYWTSSEDDSNNSWALIYPNAIQASVSKSVSVYHVRCVRKTTFQ